MGDRRQKIRPKSTHPTGHGDPQPAVPGEEGSGGRRITVPSFLSLPALLLFPVRGGPPGSTRLKTECLAQFQPGIWTLSNRTGPATRLPNSRRDRQQDTSQNPLPDWNKQPRFGKIQPYLRRHQTKFRRRLQLRAPAIPPSGPQRSTWLPAGSAGGNARGTHDATAAQPRSLHSDEQI